MIELTSKQRAFLKGAVHHQKAPFQMGKNGITDSLLKGISDYLKAKELLKLKVLEIPEDETVTSLGTSIAASLNAILVGTIGKNIILFKRNAQNPVVDLPNSKKERIREKELKKLDLLK